MFNQWFFVSLLSICASMVQAQSRSVVFVQDTMGNDFRHAQVMEAQAEAQRRGIDFRFTDGQGQTSRLISQIDDLTGQKVSVIILGTNDDKAVVPVVEKAEKAGVRVIVLDRGIAGKAYTTFINSDNHRIGVMAAEFIGQKIKGKGTVLLFEGLQSADVTHLRTRGFMDGMAKYPELRVIKRTGNYLRKDAILETEKLLAQGERFDAVFAESDSMLSGVRMVLEKNNMDPRKIISVGCDYTSEARDAIRKGTQTASILFPLGGKRAVAVAEDLLKGKQVPRHISIPVQLVTPANVEQVAPIF